MRLSSIALIIASITSASSAFGASSVSSTFDGRYTASASPVAAMSGPDCQPFMIAPITITKGLLTGAPSAGAAVQGIVTQDGFLTGALLRPGKARLTFEGRFIDGTFKGGVVESTPGCAWTVTFSAAP